MITSDSIIKRTHLCRLVVQLMDYSPFTTVLYIQNTWICITWSTVFNYSKRLFDVIWHSCLIDFILHSLKWVIHSGKHTLINCFSKYYSINLTNEFNNIKKIIRNSPDIVDLISWCLLGCDVLILEPHIITKWWRISILTAFWAVQSRITRATMHLLEVTA